MSVSSIAVASAPPPKEAVNVATGEPASEALNTSC